MIGSSHTLVLTEYAVELKWFFSTLLSGIRDGVLSRFDEFGLICSHEAQRICCFNCASTSSAIVTTAGSTWLKSKCFWLRCNVEKMLTCKRRDSSTAMATV